MIPLPTQANEDVDDEERDDLAENDEAEGPDGGNDEFNEGLLLSQPQKHATAHAIKRKAHEIADSEDEDGSEQSFKQDGLKSAIRPAIESPSLPPMPAQGQLGGFLPSSQLQQDLPSEPESHA